MSNTRRTSDDGARAAKEDLRRRRNNLELKLALEGVGRRVDNEGAKATAVDVEDAACAPSSAGSCDTPTLVTTSCKDSAASSGVTETAKPVSVHVS